MNLAVPPETDRLLAQIRAGDDRAIEPLLERHRERLRRMVAYRIDPRVGRRLDPSDVVQEALLTANQRIHQFLGQSTGEFYPWLRRIAWNRLIDLHREHIGAARRSVNREVTRHAKLPEDSAMQLVDALVARQPGPAEYLARQELSRRVKAALADLPTVDQEVLLLRFVEQLTTSQAAEVMEISESAFKGRQLRALERLRELLDAEDESLGR